MGKWRDVGGPSAGHTCSLMTYQVVFDVWQRLPQLWLGVVAAIALAIAVGAGILDAKALVKRWSLVFGLGATCVLLQLLVAGEWPFLLAGAILIGFIVVVGRSDLARTGEANELPPGTRRLIIGMVMLVFAAFQGLPMVAAIDLNRRLVAGQATIVEGPATFDGYGSKTECLSVDDQRFCYSESEVSAGYNRRRYLIGALETGQYLRLSILDGLIVRLEVRLDR